MNKKVRLFAPVTEGTGIMNKRRKTIFILLALLALLPVKIQCGQIFSGCAYPGPDNQYYTSYEVEPLGITLIETLTGTNLRIYYWRGEDAHFIGN